MEETVGGVKEKPCGYQRRKMPTGAQQNGEAQINRNGLTYNIRAS